MIYPIFEAELKALPYPDRDAIKAKVFAGFDRFVGTRVQIEAREAELAQQVYDEVKAAHAEYGRRQQEVYQAFIDALADAYGTGNAEVDAKVYSLAYDKGHAHGMSEVESHYQTFAELATAAYQAGQQDGV